MSKKQHNSLATEFKKGNKHPMYGKHHSKEHKRKVSKTMKLKFLGKHGFFWKGGKIKDSHGYILIWKPEHPFCDKRGYLYRSHFIMEKKLGRYLTPIEVVHHKGIKYPMGSIKNKQDDRSENLRLFANKSKHSKFHFPKGSMFGINISKKT